MMKVFAKAFSILSIGCVGAALAITAVAQEQASPVVPHLVRYSGALPDAPSGASVVAVHFAVYAKQTGGEALWGEDQQVAIDASGKYSVLLGSATSLQDSLFSGGEARWVGVTLGGQAEGARTPLAASAYSLKASDSETVGGHPASDFVLAAKAADGKPETATAITQINTSNGLVGGGTGPTLNLSISDSFLEGLGNNLYAQLGASNTLTGNQTINGNLTLNGSLAGSAVNNLLTSADSVFPQLGGNNTLSGTNTFTRPVTFASTQTFAGTASIAGNNAFAGTNTFSRAVTFAGGQTFPGAATLAGANAFTGSNSFSSAVTFASGQAFPGTVAAITAGTGITATTTGQTVTVAANPAALETTYNSVYVQLAGNNSLSGTNAFTKPVTFAASQTFPGTAGTTGANTYNGNQTITGAETISGTTVYTAPSSGIYTGQLTVNDSATPALAISGNAGAYGIGLYGGGQIGVYGQALGTGTIGGVAVLGSVPSNFAGTGVVYGVEGEDDSSQAANFGMKGSSVNGTGVLGQTASSGYAGVDAINTSSSGGYGLAASGYSGVSVVATGDGIDSNSTAGNGVYGTTAATGGPAGIFGNSSATSIGSDGFPGIGVSGNAAGTSAYGVYGNSTGTDGYGVFGNSASGTGVYGQSNSSGGTGVTGQAYYGVTGVSTDTTGTGFGVTGDSGPGGAVGVYGTTETSSGSGVWGHSQYSGLSSSGGNFGVLGSLGAGFSNTSLNFDSPDGSNAGVWGDQMNSTFGGSGVLATADENTALFAANNSSYASLQAENYTTATHNIIFETDSPNTYSGARHCTIDTSANITCTGVVSGVTPALGKPHAMYSVLSPENWLEDFGSGQLTHGSAHISLEAMFGDAASAGLDYHVFLTPNGECRGLYIAAKSADGFEVREIGGGRSSVSFDYRIVARRKGYEQVRMEDLSGQQDLMQARMEERRQRAAANTGKVRPGLQAQASRALRPVEHLEGAPRPTLPAAPSMPRRMPAASGLKPSSQASLHMLPGEKQAH